MSQSLHFLKLGKNILKMVLKKQTFTPQDHMSFYICSFHLTNILTRTVAFKWVVNYSEISTIEEVLPF